MKIRYLHPFSITGGARLVACILALVAPQYLWQTPSILSIIWVDALVWVLGVLLIGWVLNTLVPRYAHLGLLSLALIWLIIGVGLAETITVMIWLLSSWGIGSLLLCWTRRDPLDTPTCVTETLLIGTAFWLAIWGAMLHFSINYRSLYLGLCLFPSLWLLRFGPSKLQKKLHEQSSALQKWVQSIPILTWVIGLAAISWVLRWATLPSMTYDDQALHLRLWTELLTKHRALFDVHAQIWSVAPFAVDLLHAGLSLIAGADIRSALNLFLALILLLLTARILNHLRLPSKTQWLLIILLASTPMLGNLLLSLQSELLLAVVGLAGLRLVLGIDSEWRGEYILGILACAALCLATKLPGAVLGISLLLAFTLNWWIHRKAISHPLPTWRWPSVLVVLILLVFASLHSYGLAWWTTGNPIFPLYNAVFRSPLFPLENFGDERWIHGFTLLNYVQAFFKTSAFLESGNYVAGWQYLLLLPFALLTVWRQGQPVALRVLLLPLFGFGLAMFAATQYWRYLFPVMPIASVLLATLITVRYPKWHAIVLIGVLLCIALNLAFFPRVSGLMHASSQMAYTEAGRNQLIKRYAPVAELTAKVNRIAPSSRVLYPQNTPYGATLHGKPLYVNWYSPSRASRFRAIRDARDMKNFLLEDQVNFVIFNPYDGDTRGTQDTLLREHLARSGIALAQQGSYILYRLSHTDLQYRDVFNLSPSTGERPLSLPISKDGLTATIEPRLLASLSTLSLTQARYNVRFRCESNSGYFIAQINWDTGTPYYHLVPCRERSQSFIEAVPIPTGATQGWVYVTTRDTPTAQIEEIKIEVY